MPEFESETCLKEIENRLQAIAAKLEEAVESAGHSEPLRAEIARQITRVREVLAEIDARLARFRREG